MRGMFARFGIPIGVRNDNSPCFVRKPSSCLLVKEW